jgi:hypothetical protein
MLRQPLDYCLSENSYGLFSEFVTSAFGSEGGDILAHHILALFPNRKEWGKNMVGKNI